MKNISLKITLLVIGISFLSACYTQLSEPISREEYYSEEEYDDIPDTVYQYQEDKILEYNLGYRDGSRDFMKEYLWYGYNPNSYFYSGYRPNWNSNWGYNHSFYLGVYDPYFYDPFWDWGYYGSYFPNSYYSYNGWYNYPYSRHSYNHGYYYHQPYYHYGGYVTNRKVSEGREQLTADRQPAINTSSASQASRVSVSNNSDFQSTMNLPMSAGRGSSSTVSSSSQNNTERQPDSIPKSGRATRNVRTTKSPNEAVPGFQTTLDPPIRPVIKPTNTRSASSSRTRRTVTMPVKKSSSSKNSTPSSKSSDTQSSSGSSQSSYSAPSNTSSSSSSGTRSSNSRSSNNSSTRSSSSKSSSSDRSSKKNN